MFDAFKAAEEKSLKPGKKLGQARKLKTEEQTGIKKEELWRC